MRTHPGHSRGCGVTCASATHCRLPRVTTNTPATTSGATMYPSPTLASAPKKVHNIPEAHNTPRATWGTCGGISRVAKVGLGLKSARFHREAPPQAPRVPSRCTNIRSTVTSDIVSGGGGTSRLHRVAAVHCGFFPYGDTSSKNANAAMGFTVRAHTMFSLSHCLLPRPSVLHRGKSLTHDRGNRNPASVTNELGAHLS
jgi:hypothetical protein